jgi:hypothetical protein
MSTPESREVIQEQLDDVDERIKLHLAEIVRLYGTDEEEMARLLAMDGSRGFVLRCIAVSGDDAQTLWNKFMSDIDQKALAENAERMMRHIAPPTE